MLNDIFNHAISFWMVADLKNFSLWNVIQQIKKVPKVWWWSVTDPRFPEEGLRFQKREVVFCKVLLGYVTPEAPPASASDDTSLRCRHPSFYVNASDTQNDSHYLTSFGDCWGGGRTDPILEESKVNAAALRKFCISKNSIGALYQWQRPPPH